MCEARAGADRLGAFELTTDELRAVARHAVECAEPALVISAPPEMVQHVRERMGDLAELGIEAMDD